MRKTEDLGRFLEKPKVELNVHALWRVWLGRKRGRIIFQSWGVGAVVACEEAEETVSITIPLHPQPTPLTLSRVSSCSPCLTTGKRNRGRWVLGSIRASNFMLVFD